MQQPPTPYPQYPQQQWQQPPTPYPQYPQQQWQQPPMPAQQWNPQHSPLPPQQYQQPPQYQLPMPPPNKKSRKRLWLILAAVVLVVAIQFIVITLPTMMTCLSIPLIGVFLIVLSIYKLSKPPILPPLYQSPTYPGYTYQPPTLPPLYQSPTYPSYYPTPSRYIREKTKLKVVDRDGLICNHCGSEENLEFDHIIPFSMGGESDTANIQILCRSCNRSKGNRYSY